MDSIFSLFIHPIAASFVNSVKALLMNLIRVSAATLFFANDALNSINALSALYQMLVFLIVDLISSSKAYQCGVQIQLLVGSVVSGLES